MSINPLVAGRLEGPKDAWAGVWLAEDIELINQAVKSGSWIDGTLGVVGAGLDALAVISDPIGTLVQYGASWLIEHIKPLSQALDWLAGDPAQIAGHAQTWRNVAASLQNSVWDLSDSARTYVSDWCGVAGDAYRAWTKQQRDAVGGLAAACEAMAGITEAAGFLIGTVRIMVRDAVATVVSHLLSYVAEEAFSLGFATPLVIEQVASTVAAWAAKIAGWLRALLASLRRLVPLVRRLGKIIEELKGILTKLRGKAGHDPVPNQSGPHEPNHVPREPGTPDFTTPDIDSRKITDYAMNPDHPVGRNKYRVINSATGLGPGDAAEIERQIREGVRRGNPILGKADQYGQRWNVDVTLTGPTGTITVRTAWIVDAGSSTPRLTTISFPPK